MDDLFSEMIVERKPRAQDGILKALLIAATVIMAAAGILLGPVFMIGFLVLAIVTYFMWPRFRVEYEYSYVNGQLDIARIFSKQSRKDVAKIDVTKCECVAPLGSHQLDSYGSTYKVIDYSSGDPQMKTWVIVSGGENSCKYLVHMDERMFDDLKRRMPRKVFGD